MKYVICDRLGRYYTKAGCPTYWSAVETDADGNIAAVDKQRIEQVRALLYPADKEG